LPENKNCTGSRVSAAKVGPNDCSSYDGILTTTDRGYPDPLATKIAEERVAARGIRVLGHVHDAQIPFARVGRKVVKRR
jgi:hypothetical protein